jgi:hypothetical protein
VSTSSARTVVDQASASGSHQSRSGKNWQGRYCAEARFRTYSFRSKCSRAWPGLSRSVPPSWSLLSQRLQSFGRSNKGQSRAVVGIGPHQTGIGCKFSGQKGWRRLRSPRRDGSMAGNCRLAVYSRARLATRLDNSKFRRVATMLVSAAGMSMLAKLTNLSPRALSLVQFEGPHDHL